MVAGCNGERSSAIGSRSVTLDPTCALQLTMPTASPHGMHQLGVIVDAAPGIVFFVVDGKLCDGGVYHTRGWAWLTDLARTTDLSSAAGVHAMQVGCGQRGGSSCYGGTVGGGRVYGRALRVSELVGNYRAGPAPSPPAQPQ